MCPLNMYMGHLTLCNKVVGLQQLIVEGLFLRNEKTPLQERGGNNLVLSVCGQKVQNIIFLYGVHSDFIALDFLASEALMDKLIPFFTV